MARDERAEVESVTGFPAKYNPNAAVITMDELI